MKNMGTKTLWKLFSPWLMSLTMLGCGGSNRAAVEGKVTLDGQAVEAGTISFIPSNGNSKSGAWGDIKDGNYAIPTQSGPTVGECRVEIRWMRKTGRMQPGMVPGTEAPEFANVIPVRYNAQSELQATITPGKNQCDFSLHSAAAAVPAQR
jgi:hypothetical protein